MTQKLNSSDAKDLHERIKLRMNSLDVMEIQRLFERAFALENDPMSFIEVGRKMADLLDLYLHTTISLPFHGFWRAVKLNPGETYENTSRFLQPPTEYVKKLGRMNLRGESLLYCAPSRNIAALELHLQVGDRVVFVALASRQRLSSLLWIPVGLSRCERPILDAIQYKEQSGESHTKVYLGEDNWKKWCLIDSLLADLVTQEVKEGHELSYLGSIAIAKNLFRLGPAGIVYPSMGTQRHGINVCMTSESATKHLRPVTAYLFQVVATPFNGPTQVEGRLLKSSRHIGVDGTVDWYELKDDTTTEELDANTRGPSWARISLHNLYR